MTTRIIGLDVSKSSVTCCLLTGKPDDIRQYYYECEFFSFKADASGIKAVLALQPDIAIMEPTGVNYSRLWGTHLARAGVEVRLVVGHKQLRRYREDYLGLPDKDDEADALALACYYFDYGTSPRRFVQVRDFPITRIRELVLRLAHLNRVQSPIINRIRQDLAWQFPEVALVKTQRSSSGDVPLLWGWLAGERESVKYDKLYAASVGLGISDTVKLHAERLCHLQREERAIEIELQLLHSDERFAAYQKVFRRFGFGERISSMLLSQIYPFENYLGEDGLPEVIFRKGRRSGKLTKRYLSLRRFQKALGVAPSLEASGDMKKLKTSTGSDLCRKVLWQWVFTRIEPAKSRLPNDIGDALGKEMDEQKAMGKPIKLVRSRIAALAAKILFKELVKEFCSGAQKSVE